MDYCDCHIPPHVSHEPLFGYDSQKGGLPATIMIGKTMGFVGDMTLKKIEE
jgi:hypothetical protein